MFDFESFTEQEQNFELEEYKIIQKTCQFISLSLGVFFIRINVHERH